MIFPPICKKNPKTQKITNAPIIISIIPIFHLLLLTVTNIFKLCKEGNCFKVEGAKLNHLEGGYFDTSIKK